MEYLGTTRKGAKVFSDYGHIASSLALGYDTLRERFPDQKITLLFQPHQAKRVVDGWDDFLQAIQLYDQRCIYQLYTAREQLQNFTQTHLFQEHHFDSFEALGNFFAQKADATYLASSEWLPAFFDEREKDEIVVVFSAGDLDYLVRNLTRK